MRAMPLTIGTIHFVGIGGIGMSGIAEILKNLGYNVQGSDQSDSPNVQRLINLGIKIFIGHKSQNIDGAEVLVVSSAIKLDNPELQAARNRFLPVVRRAEMLAELMRLKWSIAIGGTHGKTTTTSMVAAVLDAASLDPTVINGGVINAYGTNARLGSGEWLVAEADESDGTFIKLPSVISVITNIDPEHLDFYGNFNNLKQAFREFINNVPFYGFAALCIDHPEVQQLVKEITDRRVVTYGFNGNADIRAINVQHGGHGARYDILISHRGRPTRSLMGMSLPMHGAHNVLNSLAAVAVANEMGIDDATIRAAFSGFKGVKRRFTRVGEVNGITIIDDYGHHPVEISAVLKAARSATRGRVVAIVQPHRYSRVAALFTEFCTCFGDADTVIVADIYAAGEAPIAGIDRDALVRGLQHHGHRNATGLSLLPDLPKLVLSHAGPGDFVVCLGAGSITQWAQALPEQISRLTPGQAEFIQARGVQ